MILRRCCGELVRFSCTNASRILGTVFGSFAETGTGLFVREWIRAWQSETLRRCIGSNFHQSAVLSYMIASRGSSNYSLF
jgi:hypothetical protein